MIAEGNISNGYQQTSVGVIPGGWTVVPITSLLPRGTRITYGVVQPGSNDANGVLFIRGGDVFAGKILESQLRRISRTVSRQYKRTELAGGEILISLVGYPGEVALVPDSLAGGNIARQVALVRLDPDQAISREYVCQYLQSNRGRQMLLNEAIGSAQQVINLRDINKVSVILPPKAEQEAIADALEDADALIESLEQLVAKKRHLKQAAMQQLLTGKKRLPGFEGEWEPERLGNLGSTYGGLTGKTKSHFGHGSARYIPFMNIVYNVVIDPTDLDRVDVDSSEGQNAVEAGDLFFNGSSETPEDVGMCSFLADDLGRIYVNSFCFGFRLRDGAQANGLFLAYYLRSQRGRELLRSLAQGATRYNLSKTALMEVEFELPEPSEQDAITQVLTDMDIEIEAIEAKLAKVRQIKQGMMQELLTGRSRLV